MDQTSQSFSDLFWPLQSRRMQQAKIHNGTKANRFSSVPPLHDPELSDKSASGFISSYSHRFQPEEPAPLTDSSLKLILEIPVFSIFHTGISKGKKRASCTLGTKAFICTCTVRVLHSVPWLVSPIRQLQPKITEAGLISPYLLSTYKMFLKTLSRHMH